CGGADELMRKGQRRGRAVSHIGVEQHACERTRCSRHRGRWTPRSLSAHNSPMGKRAAVRASRLTRTLTVTSLGLVAALSVPACSSDESSPPQTQTPNWEAKATELLSGPDWYRHAVFYEVYVRSFQDSDGDGIGDFKGLTSKLDYLKELGVDGIWLMPIMPSPFVDSGYDVADYRGITPDYGTME